jgi:hypothetical protein
MSDTATEWKLVLNTTVIDTHKIKVNLFKKTYVSGDTFYKFVTIINDDLEQIMNDIFMIHNTGKVEFIR